MGLKIAFTELRTRKEDGSVDVAELKSVFVIPHTEGYYLLHHTTPRRIYFLNDKGLYDGAPFSEWEGEYEDEHKIFREAHRAIKEMKRRAWESENKTFVHLNEVNQYSDSDNSHCCTAVCAYKSGAIDGYIDFLYPKEEERKQNVEIFQNHVFDQLENLYNTKSDFLDEFLVPAMDASSYVDYYENHKGFKPDFLTGY